MLREPREPRVSACSHVALALSVLLCQLRLSTPAEQQGAQNKPPKYPCMPAEFPTAYDTFLKRHLPEGQPDSLDQNQWQKFIKQNNLCDRPTQSFLRYEDKQQVLGVCSPDGGRILRDNLCISGRNFSFVTVRIMKNTCDIHSVNLEDKYLILACDDIKDRCRPVHFEGNRDDLKPEKTQLPCEWPQRSEAGQPMAGWVAVMPLLSLPWLTSQ